MSIVGQVLYLALFIFFVLLIVRVVIDWVQVLSRQWRPKGAVLVVAEIVYTVTDPPLRALRRVIPPLRLGQFAIDLAFIVLVLVVSIAMNLVRLL